MNIGRSVAVVGSRDFRNYAQIERILNTQLTEDDDIVSGGAAGADSFAQRYAKEHGKSIYIIYPRWEHGRSAGFARDKKIVENADLVFAFYATGKFAQGGTAHTANWARELGVKLVEFEEE